jgi:mono/diheme cytochrome c family protein
VIRPGKFLFVLALAATPLTAPAALPIVSRADAGPPDAAAVEQFEKRVRPLLVAKCQACHGADVAEGGLRLDSAAALTKGGDSGPVVMPGMPDESRLISAVRRTGDLKMPPDDRLSEQQVDDLVAWVSAGAVWPDDMVASASAPVEAAAEVAPLAPDAGELAGYLELWLRADALSHPDKEPVVVWPDQSSHGRDLSATAGVRPDGVGLPPKFIARSRINARPAVRFDPTSGLAASPGNPIAINGDAAFTIVLVINLQPNDAQPPFDGVLGIGNPAFAGDPGRPLAALVQINRDASNHSLRLAGGWNHDASLGPGSFLPLYDRSLVLVIVKTPGEQAATTRFYLNGDPSEQAPWQRAVAGDPTTPDIQHRTDIGAYMGRALSWSGSIRGDVSEAAVYSTALAEEQRAAIEAHLSDKYAITLGRQFRATRVAFTPEQRGHWSFRPVRDPRPPEPPKRIASDGGSAAPAWGQSPIDRFVLVRLIEQGLEPSPAADRRTLIRRVTFDLTGLPPTPGEIDAFLADESPRAFATVVDRLLESPHYGERWGRHWLDVVRFAETTANDANAVMRYAYRYRDYVVDAFNRDLPYDQFIVEQLAGDLLRATESNGDASAGDATNPADMSAYVRRMIATGFLMIGPKALAETDKEQTRLDIVDDQIDVTGRAFLGLTLACARCHDHKFDPIPTVDYYALAGIFRGTEPFADEVRNASMWWEYPLFEAPGEAPFMVMAPKEGMPRNLRVHVRGNRFSLGRVAPRGFLQVLAKDDASISGTPTASEPLPTTGSGRLELARWIASADNPLTARVLVNRVWQHHFGQGLVATGDNFGPRGEAPSHPELLDYLAARFVEGGWSVKGLHRLMLLSSTYQQQSRVHERGQQLDPDNRLLWRMPRRRLEAESIRDAMLAVSGGLDRSIGGGESAAIMYEVAEVLDGKRGFAANRLQTNHAIYTDSTRRSIYLPVVRNALPDVLALFDAADPNGVTPQRNDTTVPSQALFSMNSPFVRQQALRLARGLLADGSASDAARVGRAYALVLGRPPSDEEVAEAAQYVSQYLSLASAEADATGEAGQAERRLAAWQSYCQLLFCLNEFLYVD